MKRFSMRLLVIAVIAAAGCGFNNNTLAVYDGGVISGGDLVRWLDDMEIPSGEIFDKDKEKKKQLYLRRIAFEHLQLMEIKKTGYDLNPEYIERITAAEIHFTAEYFRRRLHESCDFSEDAVKARIIRLKIKSSKDARVKIDGKDYPRSLQDKLDFMKSLIVRINNGSSFAELALKYSDDYSSKDGGDIGYIVSGMRDRAFIDAALKLEKGEMTQEPVVIGDSVYIIMAEDRIVVTPETAGKTAVKESEGGRLIRRLKINAVKDMELRLGKEPDVISYVDDVICSGKGSVIFKIGDGAFTCGDLDKVIESGKKNRRAMGLTPGPFDQKRTRLIAGRIFRDRLLDREARRMGIDRDEKYIRQWAHVKNSILLSFYMDQVHFNSANDSVLNGPESDKSGEIRTIDKRNDLIRKLEQRLLDENHFTVL